MPEETIMTNAKSKGKAYRENIIGGWIMGMVDEEDIFRFLRGINGEATLREISSALRILEYSVLISTMCNGLVHSIEFEG